MNLHLVLSNNYYATQEFTINGVTAKSSDFGKQYDRSMSESPYYICANMQFTRTEPTIDILEKYKITEKEYHEICGSLEKALSFGCCGLCS